MADVSVLVRPKAFTVATQFEFDVSDANPLFEVRAGVDVERARDFVEGVFVAVRSMLTAAVAGEAIEGDTAHACRALIEMGTAVHKATFSPQLGDGA